MILNEIFYKVRQPSDPLMLKVSEAQLMSYNNLIKFLVHRPLFRIQQSIIIPNSFNHPIFQFDLLLSIQLLFCQGDIRFPLFWVIAGEGFMDKV